MQVTNITSPSFGAIVVKTKGMNERQRAISERLFRDLKYNANYSKLEKGNNLNIYMFAKKEIGGIEVRIIDLLSGKYIKDAAGRIFKRTLCDTKDRDVASVTDRVVQVYENITKGTLTRPECNVNDFFKGKTDIAKIDKAALAGLREDYVDFKKAGICDDASARQLAYHNYTSHEPRDKDIF